MLRALLFGALLAAPTALSAATLSVSNDESALLDGSYVYRDFTVTAPAGAKVTDVNLSVRFSKNPGRDFVAEGGPYPSGDGWNNEIEMVLISPTGIMITLINNTSVFGGLELVKGEGAATFIGRAPGFAGEIIFDQQADKAVDEDVNAPLRGHARPSDRLKGDLNSFNGELAAGVWRLFVEDDRYGDAISFYGARLELTTDAAAAPVPLPAGLPLMLGALGALGLARRKG